ASPSPRSAPPPEMALHTFHTPQPVELELKIPAGEVAVEAAGGEESPVPLEGDERLVDQTVVELAGNKLRVELEGGKGPFGITIAFGSFTIGRASLRIHVRVPHDSRVELSTAAADMVVRGRVGSLETKSASGDLSVDAHVAGNAVVKTVSG